MYTVLINESLHFPMGNTESNSESPFWNSVADSLQKGIADGIANYGNHDNDRYQGVTKIEHGPFGTQVYLNDNDAIRVAFGTPLETVLPFSGHNHQKLNTACRNLGSSSILMSNRGSGVILDMRDTGSPYGYHATVRNQ